MFELGIDVFVYRGDLLFQLIVYKLVLLVFLLFMIKSLQIDMGF